MECGGFPIDWMFWSAIPAANWECLGEKGSGDDGRDDDAGVDGNVGVLWVVGCLCFLDCVAWGGLVEPGLGKVPFGGEGGDCLL